MVWAISLEYQDRSTPHFKLDPFDDRPSPSRSYGFSKGFWVDPSRQPKSAQQTTKKLVHDIFPLPGLNAVRQRFKDLVEEFEPGVHQFFPIVLRDKQGEPIGDNFYIFNCMVSMDAVLAKETGLELKYPPGAPPEYYFEAIFGRDEKVFISKPQIKGHHLWMGLHIRPHGSWVFVSDEFFAALEKQKIKYLRAHQLHEVEAPWIAEEQIKPILDWEVNQPFDKWSGASRLRKIILDQRGKLEL